MQEIATLSTKLASIESELIDVGLIEVSHANDFLLGHRLAKAESELAQLKEKEDSVLLPMDAAWVLTCATLVFLMQLGFAQLEVRQRPLGVCAQTYGSTRGARTRCETCDACVSTMSLAPRPLLRSRVCAAPRT